MTAHLKSDRPQEVVKFNWDLVHTAIDCIAHTLNQGKRPHLFVAIARGGLIPATILSHKLNVPLEVISASAYEGTRRTLQKQIVVEGWKPEYHSEHVIFIDDIMDTGDTWDAVLYGGGRSGTQMKGTIFTLAKKPHARFPDFQNYFALVPNACWVEFPWEKS